MGNFSLEGARKDLEDLLTGFRSKLGEQEKMISSGESPVYGQAVAIPDPIATAAYHLARKDPAMTQPLVYMPEANLRDLFGPLLGGPVQDVYNKLREKFPNMSGADLLALIASLGMGRNVMASNMERYTRFEHAMPQVQEPILNEMRGGTPSGESGPVSLFKELMGRRQMKGPIPLTDLFQEGTKLPTGEFVLRSGEILPAGRPIRPMSRLDRSMFDLLAPHEPTYGNTLFVDPAGWQSSTIPRTKFMIASTPGAASHEFGHLKQGAYSKLMGYRGRKDADIAAYEDMMNDLYHSAPDRLSQEWGRALGEELGRPVMTDARTGRIETNWGYEDPTRGSKFDAHQRMLLEADANAHAYAFYKQKYGKDKALEMVRGDIESSLFSYAYNSNKRLKSFIENAVDVTRQRMGLKAAESGVTPVTLYRARGSTGITQADWTSSKAVAESYAKTYERHYGGSSTIETKQQYPEPSPRRPTAAPLNKEEYFRADAEIKAAARREAFEEARKARSTINLADYLPGGKLREPFNSEIELLNDLRGQFSQKARK